MAKYPGIKAELIHETLGTSGQDAQELLGLIRARRKACKRLDGRVDSMDPIRLRKEIMYQNMLSQSWTAGSNTFEFFEVDEFSKDSTGKPLNWDKHGESKPGRILGVNILNTDGTWTTLPINVGFTYGKAAMRMGYATAFKSNPILRKDGGTPHTATISGYVQDHDPNNQLLFGETKDPKTGKTVRPLGRKDIRGRVEHALIKALHSADIDLVHSSILFNVRNNPSQGVAKAHDGFYKEFEKMILPVGGVYNQTRRALVKALGKDFSVSEQDGNNGVVWIVYVNDKNIDIGKLPKTGLDKLFAEQKFVESTKHASDKDHKDLFNMIKTVTHAAFGLTNIQQAVVQGFAEYLPESIFTEEQIMERDQQGTSFQVVDPHATEHSSQIIKRTTRGWSIMHHLAVRGQWHCLPTEAYSKKSLTLADNSGLTPMHWLFQKQETTVSEIEAIKKELGRIATKLSPRELQEVLLSKSTDGRTPMHSAAANGLLSTIPKEALTIQALSVQDSSGWSPLHSAAARDRLTDALGALSLPAAQIKELLQIKGKDNNTPEQLTLLRQRAIPALDKQQIDSTEIEEGPEI